MAAGIIFTILCSLILLVAVNGTVLRHPESVRVSTGEWSNFTCSINCSQHHSLRWRFAVPSTGALDGPYLKSRHFRRFGAKNGITVEMVSKEGRFCQTQGGEITEVIRIMAVSTANGTVVQCAAIGLRGEQNYYSKFALMAVEPLQRESASQNSSMPTS